MVSQKLKWQVQSLHWSIGLHQVCCLCVIAVRMVFLQDMLCPWCFCLSLGLLLILDCLVQLWCESFCIALLYLVLSCLFFISWRSALFWRGNGGRVDLGQGAIKRWTLVGGRGTEAVIEMYCVRKNLFQKK